MKRPKALGFAVALLLAGLWAAPLMRAVSFFQWAQSYLQETDSLNALNDFRFSIALLASYSLSLLAGLTLGWLLSRRPGIAFLLPIALLAFAAAEAFWICPEEPIHLFPTMAPWRPACISISTVAIAALFVYFPPRPHEPNTQPGASANAG